MSIYLPEPEVVPAELRKRRYTPRPKATFTHKELADMRHKGIAPSEVVEKAAKNPEGFDARKRKPYVKREEESFILRFRV